MSDVHPPYENERVLEAPSPATLELISPYLPQIRDSAAELAADFYATLLQRTESHRYLDNSIVEARLMAEWTRWLQAAFSTESMLDVATFEARQQQIGEIHARIRVPVHLVNIGALRLRSQISNLVRARTDQPWESRYDAMRFFESWIDGAITAMTRAGIRRIVDRTRVEESYRLFSLDQDMNLERERQRSSLLEWSQSTLFATVHAQNVAAVDELAFAPFGRWVRHRAEIIFGSTPQLAEINSAVAHVDRALLPTLRSDDLGVRMETLQMLGAEVERILALLGEMFEGLSELELGRDALTRTLNRRFLSSILLREIGFANTASMSLSGFMVDVDSFKDINDLHGHHAGDAVLRTLAGILADTVRSSDFVFRYGGEEFFVLLVETELSGGVDMAERIRRSVADSAFNVGDTRIGVTVSIGVASYDGHPDPDDLVRRADTALATAKRSGRNRVAVA
ncbi:diguanylate cyclase [Mycobacterium sp. C31M]